MNVQYVVDFITALRNEKKDKEYLGFLDDLNQHFNGRSPDDIINEDDIRYLYATFGAHWYNAPYAPFHYTTFVDEWKPLVEQLSTGLDLSVNQFLMPALLVSHILTFLSQVDSKKEHFAPGDERLLQEIAIYFSTKEANSKLTLNDYEFLKEIYKKRWNVIQKGEHDYTHYTAAPNNYWIALAKKLEASEFDSDKDSFEKKIGYLHILMTTIDYPYDFHNLRDNLLQINDLRHLFLVDGKYLHRKLGIAKYTQQQKYLFALQGVDSRRPYSIEELYRLKKFSPKDTVSISSNGGDIKYEGFWGFLEKAVFPHLTSAVVPEVATRKGRMPYFLLKKLVELVAEYYQLKASGAEHFPKFKIKLNDFFNLFESDTYPLVDVNFLYGQKVPCKDTQYLLDIFITLYSAKAFDLDTEMKAIGKFLFKVYPVYKSMRHALGEDSADSPIIPDFMSPEEYKNGILVSLFATSFQSNSQSHSHFKAGGAREVIAYCDQSNRIPQELLNNYYDSSKSKRLFVTKSPWKRNEPVQKVEAKTAASWTNAVQRGRLVDVGGFWLSPEAIFAVLGDWVFVEPLLEVRDNLLSEIIYTYAQLYVPTFEKQFRVNVLFSKFMASTSITDECKASIVSSIMDYSSNPDALKFHMNVSNYLHRYLNTLSDSVVPEYLPSSGALMFPDNPLQDVIIHYMSHTIGESRAKNYLIELRAPFEDPKELERTSDIPLSLFTPI